ncbi:AAA family ATPase [soil metagenome]
MKAIAFINLKGGVGKTTLAVNFAAFCGSLGHKTLLIDLDPQTNATFCCISPDQWREHRTQKGTVADLLKAREHTNAGYISVVAEDVTLKGFFENVDLLPSDLDLFTVDLELAARTAREQILNNALDGIKHEYDVFVCDCPPNLTIPTQNAIALSDFYVIPVSPDYLSALGVSLLKNRVQQITQSLRHNITSAGIAITRSGRATNHRDATIEALRAQFPGEILSPVLVERNAVKVAQQQNIPIFDHSPKSKAAVEFERLCQSIIAKVGL